MRDLAARLTVLAWAAPLTALALAMLVIGCTASSSPSERERPAELRSQNLSPPSPRDDADSYQPTSSSIAAMPGGLPIQANDPDHFDFLEYQTYDDGPYGFRTVLSIFSPSDHIDYDMLGLEIICDSQVEGGLLWALAAAYPSFEGAQRNIFAPIDTESGLLASIVFTRSSGTSDVYLEFELLDARWAQLLDARELLAIAQGYETALVRLPFEGDYISAEIDLRGVFNTPIQPNLDWCGTY